MSDQGTTSGSKVKLCEHSISHTKPFSPQTTYSDHVSITQAMLSLRWKFPSPRRLLTSLNLLCLLWLLLLLYLEHFIYLRAIENCSWQLDAPKECRLAIVADPQIVDENTYPRRGLAMWLTKVFTDRYMRRNWRMLMKQEPGTVIFLGDLMDGGREWEDDKYSPPLSFNKGNSW